jgi:hypoxanthine phosphoribosyltransferase
MTTISIKDKSFVPYILADEISQQIKVVAKKLNTIFVNKNPVLLGVLKGSYMFYSDLTKELTFDCTMSFVQLSSYTKTESLGKIKEVQGLSDSIENREVIIIEDIVDRGHTIKYLKEYLGQFNPASVTVVTLFFKKDAYCYATPPEHYLFSIPNKFIVGYGLDYDQYGRNLKDIYQIEND